VSYTLLLSKS